MGCFMDIEFLNGLENEEKWNDARELLYNAWKNDKNNSGLFIRLLSECWHVLSLWDCCINNENLSVSA